MQIVTVSPKFQVCIPKAAREQLHLKAGQKFICIVKADGLYFIPRKSIKDLKGMLAGANPKNFRDHEDRI
jgi:AbrB family looped-hinge helix DNA binding protein